MRKTNTLFFRADPDLTKRIDRHKAKLSKIAGVEIARSAVIRALVESALRREEKRRA